MPHTLSVTVHVDLDLKEVTLAVLGCLTAQTLVSLLPIVTQARQLDPAPRLTLDLMATGHIDLDGLVPLQHALRHEPTGELPAVTWRIPDPLPVCRRTVPMAPRDWAGTGSTGDGDRGPLALVRGTDAVPGTRTLEALPASSRAATAGPSRARRDEILEGAARMFAEHGYFGASLRDISRHIGISHPGLMHHFESKSALLHAVVDGLESHAQRAVDQVEAMSSAPETLPQSLTTHWHPASLPVQLLTTLGAESVSGDHPGRFRMARLRRVHEHVLEQCFTEFDRQGRLRPGLNPAFAGRAMFGLVLSLAVREKTVRTMQNGHHDDAPIEELYRLARSFLRHAGEL